VTTLEPGTGPVTEPEAGPTESIGRQAARGLRWSFAGTLITKIGSFAMGLILARLLTPDDFGVFAVALAAMAFVMHVNDVGLIAATVQWRGKLEDMAPTASAMAMTFSVIVYGFFWFAAPLIASVAHAPEATGVIRLLTTVILVDGITAVRSAALMRTFRQDKLIVANLVGLVVNAAVAISLAAEGAGPYAFAAGMVANFVVTGIMVFFGAKVPARLGFDRAIAKQLMVFGLPLAASLGIEAVLLNADYIIIGHLVGEVSLGYYLLAFNISTWALSVISSAVRYVSVAGFSRLSEVDAETLSAGVQRSMPILVTGLMPIAALTAALALPIVTVLYGDKWTLAASVLPYLMVLTVVRVLASFALDILMGAGATRSTLWVNLGWAVALVPSLIFGTAHGGIRGAAVAHAIVGLLVAVPVVLIALHKVGVRLAPIVPALARPVIAGAVAGAIAMVVAKAVGPNAFLELIVGGLIGGVVYVALAIAPSQLRQWSGLLVRRKEAHAVE
jgi:O-antigen/teichoic acid export membrane protein